MIPGIEPLYQPIADSIANSIPEDWTTAKMEAVFFSDSVDYCGEYTRADGVQRSFKTARAACVAFKELRQRFKDAGQPVWGQACFELASDGKFQMHWRYDNCDENGDTLFDEDEWHKAQEERRQRLSR